MFHPWLECFVHRLNIATVGLDILSIPLECLKELFNTLNTAWLFKMHRLNIFISPCMLWMFEMHRLNVYNSAWMKYSVKLLNFGTDITTYKREFMQSTKQLMRDPSDLMGWRIDTGSCSYFHRRGCNMSRGYILTYIWNNHCVLLCP